MAEFNERDRVDGSEHPVRTPAELDAAARREKMPGDVQAPTPRATRPLTLLPVAVLVLAFVVLGLMFGVLNGNQNPDPQLGQGEKIVTP